MKENCIPCRHMKQDTENQGGLVYKQQHVLQTIIAALVVKSHPALRKGPMENVSQFLLKIEANHS